MTARRVPAPWADSVMAPTEAGPEADQEAMAVDATTNKSGVKLTKQAMNQVEKQLQRQPGLEKWFVDIYPPPNAWDT